MDRRKSLPWEQATHCGIILIQFKIALEELPNKMKEFRLRCINSLSIEPRKAKNNRRFSKITNCGFRELLLGHGPQLDLFLKHDQNHSLKNQRLSSGGDGIYNRD